MLLMCLYIVNVKMQEKVGPKLESEKLLLRGQEEKFLNSLR